MPSIKDEDIVVRRLTDKQQLYVIEYCANGYNAAQAYKMAYPNCKGNYNKLGAENKAKQGIKDAIDEYKARTQAKNEYDREQAMLELNEQIDNFRKLAARGNTAAGKVIVALLREKNCITGLQQQVNINKGDGLNINITEAGTYPRKVKGAG